MALTTIKVAAMSANSVDSDQYVDGSIDNAHLADNAVGVDELADAINTDIAAKAPLASPTFTGTVAIPNIANLETAVAANTTKVTNATHTGDVTGGTALTIAAGAVETAMIAAGAVTSIRNIPASTNSTLVAADAGKHISITAGITINASTDFAIGDAVTIFNNQGDGNDETITATGVTLYLASDATESGNRTLAGRGVVTILCVAADTYVITGAGLS
jgi:hypothetical protein